MWPGSPSIKQADTEQDEVVGFEDFGLAEFGQQVQALENLLWPRFFNELLDLAQEFTRVWCGSESTQFQNPHESRTGAPVPG